MRLIDGDALRQAVITDYYEHYTQYHDSDQVALINMVEYDIEELETIDPETLPIVQKLKEQLAKVTAERDAAIKDLYEVCDCETCKNTDCVPRSGTGKCRYEWKGLQEVQSDEMDKR